jgi:hypothetical protein
VSVFLTGLGRVGKNAAACGEERSAKDLIFKTLSI